MAFLHNGIASSQLTEHLNNIPYIESVDGLRYPMGTGYNKIKLVIMQIPLTAVNAPDRYIDSQIDMVKDKQRRPIYINELFDFILYGSKPWVMCSLGYPRAFTFLPGVLDNLKRKDTTPNWDTWVEYIEGIVGVGNQDNVVSVWVPTFADIESDDVMRTGPDIIYDYGDWRKDSMRYVKELLRDVYGLEYSPKDIIKDIYNLL